MEPIVPLISSTTCGPLGVAHLPRLWLKALLAAYGRLPEGYKDIRPGFDLIVLEALRVDPEAARAYINGVRPTYPQFEAWIQAQPGVDLSPATVAHINETIATRPKPTPEARQEMLEAAGFDASCPITASSMINNLDDWREIHAQLGS